MPVWLLLRPAQKANIMAPGPIKLPPTGGSSRTRQTFAIDTLNTLGAPITQNNVDALLAQFAAEEPPGENAANNPANVEYTTALSHHDKGSIGHWSIAQQIATFDTWAHGIWNYANELRIIAPTAVADLKANKPASQTVTDLAASGWGTSASTMLGALGASPDAPIQGGGPVVGSGNLPGSSPSGGITDAVGGATSGITNAIGSAISSTESFAIRAGKVVLGLALILAVIFFAVR